MKRLMIFIPIFLACVFIITAITPVVTMSESISKNVFRLHIIANSNSDEDQQLKLLVRDKVLQYSQSLYSTCKTVEDAINVSENHLNDFKDVAQKTIAFNGHSEEAKVAVTKEYFSTRRYDDFTLPAGEYNTLKIEIGSAKGHNWWCVMFPTVCLSGCTDDFDDTLTEDERNMIESHGYAVRFKAVEIYEKVKSLF